VEVCDNVDNDCDGAVDEDWRSGGKYVADAACGNCYTDCTAIYARPNAYGECAAAGAPACVMRCCRNGAAAAGCDGGDYWDLNGVPDDGCELALDPDAIYVSASDPGASDAPGCGRGPVATGGGRHPCATIGA